MQPPAPFRDPIAMRTFPTGWIVVLTLCTMSICAGAADAPDKAPQTPQQSNPTYHVVDGYKVDANTMNGFRAWRAAACDRCHGANQEGLVGPSLLESLKTLSKEDFVKTVAEGRLDKGMPSFKTSQTVMDNTDGLYAYLKGRSNGDITQARVQELKQ